MIRKAVVCLVGMATATTSFAQSEITIKGKVKFTEPDFKVQLIERHGREKTVLAEAPVNSDNTYSMTVKVDKPKAAELNCANWQSVNVWLEDEDLGVNFRGLDTAKIKIKNPPYVYINGGKNNELMNLLNYENYRHYQNMIAISQKIYRSKFNDADEKQNLSMELYGSNDDNYRAHCKYLVEHYGDRNSVLVAINGLKYDTEKELIDRTLANLSQQSAAGKELADNYLKAQQERIAQEAKMRLGNPAPDFEFMTPDGKKKKLSDFKGKPLILDFWASWCGPCRAETPILKEYYDEYKDKGIEFLSISIDENEEAWHKAHKEDGAQWPQGRVNDSGKKVMELYQFGGIPFIIILDKDGNIYRKQLRGKKTQQAIEDVLSGKPVEQPKAIGGVSMGAAMM